MSKLTVADGTFQVLKMAQKGPSVAPQPWWPISQLRYRGPEGGMIKDQEEEARIRQHPLPGGGSSEPPLGPFHPKMRTNLPPGPDQIAAKGLDDMLAQGPRPFWRPPLGACAACHTAKAKCDREMPCGRYVMDFRHRRTFIEGPRLVYKGFKW